LGQREGSREVRVGPGQKRERWRRPRPKPEKKWRGRRKEKRGGSLPSSYLSAKLQERKREKREKNKGAWVKREKRAKAKHCAKL
jgi:hypothetical protein